MASARPSYINAIFIQSRGVVQDPPCAPCAAVRPGLRSFPECRRTPRYSGGCNGNCKCRHYCSRCTAQGNMATLAAALARNCTELSERKKSDIEDQLTAESSAEYFLRLVYLLPSCRAHTPLYAFVKSQNALQSRQLNSSPALRVWSSHTRYARRHPPCRHH
jgi:Protein of unknown function (DUF3716)